MDVATLWIRASILIVAQAAFAVDAGLAVEFALVAYGGFGASVRWNSVNERGHLRVRDLLQRVGVTVIANNEFATVPAIMPIV